MTKCYAGPCSSDEVFFTRGQNSASGIESCYRVKFTGKSRFDELNSVCSDSSNRGSFKSPMSRRDPEINLLLGALHFLHITNTSDKYQQSFEFFNTKLSKEFLFTHEPGQNLVRRVRDQLILGRVGVLFHFSRGVADSNPTPPPPP